MADILLDATRVVIEQSDINAHHFPPTFRGSVADNKGTFLTQLTCTYAIFHSLPAAGLVINHQVGASLHFIR